MSKLDVFQEKETEILKKKENLEKLIKDCSLTNENLETLVNENTPIDAEFFRALEGLNALQKVKEKLLNRKIFLVFT